MPAQKRKSSLADHLIKRRRVDQKCSVIAASKRKSHCSDKSADSQQKSANTRDSARKLSNPTRQVMSVSHKAISSRSQLSYKSKAQKQSSRIKNTLRRNSSKQLRSTKIKTKKTVVKTVGKQCSKKTVKPVQKKSAKTAVKKTSLVKVSSKDKNAVLKRGKSTSNSKNCSAGALNVKYSKSEVVKSVRNSDRTASSNSKSEQIQLKQDTKKSIPKKTGPVLLPTRSSLRQAIQKSQKLFTAQPALLENVPLPEKSFDKTVKKEITAAVQSTARDVESCKTETRAVQQQTDLSHPTASADLSQKMEKPVIKPVQKASRTEITKQNEKHGRSLRQKDGSDLLGRSQYVGKNKASKTITGKGHSQNSQSKCLPEKGSRSDCAPSVHTSDKKSAKGAAAVKVKTLTGQEKEEQDQVTDAEKASSAKNNKTEKKKKVALDAVPVKKVSLEGNQKEKVCGKLKKVGCKSESAGAVLKKNAKKEKLETKPCKKKSKSDLAEFQDQQTSNKSSKKKQEQGTEKQDTEPLDCRKKKVKQKLMSAPDRKGKLKAGCKQKISQEAKKKLKNGTVCSAVTQVTPAEESEQQLKSKQPSILELCEEIAEEIESDTVEVKKDLAKMEEEPKDTKEDEEKPSESEKSEINELPKEVGQGSQSHRFFTSKSLFILKKELIENMNRRRSKAYKDHSWSKIKHLKTSHVNHISTPNHSSSPKPGIVPKWFLALKQGSQMVIEEVGSEAKMNTEECTAKSMADGSKKVKPHKPVQDVVPDERTHYLRPAIIQLLKEFQELDEQTEESASDENFSLRFDSSPENSPLKSSEGLSPLKQTKADSNNASQQFLINQAKSGPETVQPERSLLKEFKREAENAPQGPVIPKEIKKEHEHKSLAPSLPNKGKKELESALQKSLSPKHSKTESQDVTQGPSSTKQSKREFEDAPQGPDLLRQTKRETEVCPQVLTSPNQFKREPKKACQGLPQTKHRESKEAPQESSLPKQANNDSEDALQGQSPTKQVKQEAENALQKQSPEKQAKRRLDGANQGLSPPKQAKKETKSTPQLPSSAEQASTVLDSVCQGPSATKPGKTEPENVTQEVLPNNKAKTKQENGKKKTPPPKETRNEVEDVLKGPSAEHVAGQTTNPNTEKSKSVPLDQHSAAKGNVMPSEASIQKEVRRLKEAEDDDQQLTIDAGQKRFGAVTCSICGMLYTASNPEDETQHLLFHNQFVSAVKYVGWKKERILAEYPDGKIIMVLPDDPKYALRKVEEIREMVDNDLGFQQAPLRCPSKTKSLLFISNDKKVVGCLIAEHIHRGYRVIEESRVEERSDKDGSLFERQRAWCCSTVPEPAICGISRIWVFSVMRRMRIASRLIDCLRSNFIFGSYLGKEEIAFSDPTPDGKLFATWYCGTPQFMVYNFIS